VNHGALVFGVEGEILRRKRLTAEHVRSILAPTVLPKGVPFACIVDDALFVNDPADERWAWAHTMNRRVERFEVERVGEADKIVFGSNGASAAVQERISLEHTLTVYRWGDGYLEITADEADKGTALALIAAQLGVEREDVVAFGDGTNDVSMLAWAGRSVSVGPHAPEEVRAVAQEHIDAPEDLGVAHWLQANALS
jgi:HAD-superfamily hydrolase, subfamily IIB